MIDINAHVRAVVDAAPPPTADQVARIRLILWGPQLQTPKPVPAALPDAA